MPGSLFSVDESSNNRRQNNRRNPNRRGNTDNAREVTAGELRALHIVEKIGTLRQTTPYDCYLIVGNTRIPTHEVVVTLNSSLLKKGVVTVDRERHITEIKVTSEFDDKAEVIKEVVNGFYSGILQITDNTAETMYKFSKTYDIKWLLQQTTYRLLTLHQARQQS